MIDNWQEAKELAEEIAASQQRTKQMIADAKPLTAREVQNPQHSMTLEHCLQILASYTSAYQPGIFVLESNSNIDGALASITPAAWWRREGTGDDPVSLSDPATICFEGGPFYHGRRVGTLSVCFVHKVSTPLEVVASISGVWDIAAADEVQGVLEWSIIWRNS